MGPGRHHLRVAVDTEARFWAVYDAGTGADAAADAAGVGRSSGYRWLDRRFCELRAAGFTVKGAQRLLRLSDQVTVRAERQRAAAKLRERQAAMAAHEEALRSSCWDRPHQLRVDLVEVNPNHLLAEPNRRSFFRADGVRNPGLMACPSWTAP